MAKLTAADRKHIPKGDFAVPSKAPGSGSYPIPDQAHAANALARSSGKSAAPEVRRAVDAKFPGMKPGADKSSPAKPSTSSTAAHLNSRKLPEARGTGGSRGASGLDAAMSAHADKMHPTKGSKADGPSIKDAGY